MPDKLLVAIVDEYVIVCFGINETMTTFETAFGAVYPNGEIAYQEAMIAQ